MFGSLSLDPFSKAAAILENVVEFVMILSERDEVRAFWHLDQPKKLLNIIGGTIWITEIRDEASVSKFDRKS